MPNVPYSKIAEVALTILGRASIPATDELLAYAQGARALLRGIANGTLTVTVAAEPVADIQKGDSTP